MARTKATLSGTARLSDYLAVGYLAMQCPVNDVRRTLEHHGVHSKRQRGIPRDVLVYYVMMMVLYANVAYEEVFQYVIEGLRRALGDESLAQRSVCKSAISQARTAVGAAPFKDLYDSLVTPHGPAHMTGVMFHGKRIMALDGSTLDMPDEQANATAFGYAQSQHGQAAFPLLRFVALVECGTHTLCYANPGAFTQGEVTLAHPVLAKANASMVITADRLFYGYELWQAGLASGAMLVWRVKKSLNLVREHTLPDGSYLSRVYPDARSKRKQAYTTVRVVEYTVRSRAGKAYRGQTGQTGHSGQTDAAKLSGCIDCIDASESMESMESMQSIESIDSMDTDDTHDTTYRLITNWMGADAPSAQALAELYHTRWAIEESLDELKTHLATGKLALRSKRPELVRQEFYALLMAHAAIRALMTQAGAHSGQSALDVSFTHAVQVLKRRLPGASAIPP
jgi:Insertion element 4 transposase N-terminal/Transposase DDE domain